MITSLSYINLSPGYINPFSDDSHNKIYGILQDKPITLLNTDKNYDGYLLHILVVARRKTRVLNVEGPKFFRKKKFVEYIFNMPEDSFDSFNNYIIALSAAFNMISPNFDAVYFTNQLKLL